MDFDYKILEEKFKQLPEEIQEVLTSIEVANNIKSIADKNGLLLEQTSVLSDLVSYILLGLVHSNEFVKILSRQAKIKEVVAKEIADEINVEVFGKIRSSMREHLQNQNSNTSQHDIYRNSPETNQENLENNKPPHIAELERAGGFTIDDGTIHPEHPSVTTAPKVPEPTQTPVVEEMLLPKATPVIPITTPPQPPIQPPTYSPAPILQRVEPIIASPLVQETPDTSSFGPVTPVINPAIKEKAVTETPKPVEVAPKIEVVPISSVQEKAIETPNRVDIQPIKEKMMTLDDYFKSQEKNHKVAESKPIEKKKEEHPAPTHKQPAEEKTVIKPIVKEQEIGEDFKKETHQTTPIVEQKTPIIKKETAENKPVQLNILREAIEKAKIEPPAKVPEKIVSVPPPNLPTEEKPKAVTPPPAPMTKTIQAVPTAFATKPDQKVKVAEKSPAVPQKPAKNDPYREPLA